MNQNNGCEPGKNRVPCFQAVLMTRCVVQTLHHVPPRRESQTKHHHDSCVQVLGATVQDCLAGGAVVSMGEALDGRVVLKVCD